MSEIGYIKLHRALNNWEWKDDPKMMALWVHLLLNANYEQSKYRGHTIEAGQIVIGLNALAAKTGLSLRSVRTCLDRLKKSQKTTIKTTNKFSILTIVNWRDYQQNDKPTTSKTTNQRQTNDKPTTTSKEAKKQRSKEYIRAAQTAPSPEPKILPKKASRLSPDWKLPDEWGEWAEQMSLPPPEIISQAELFRDYWIAKSGKDATKLDWEATWRNWIRRYVQEYKK